jgi:hypothetical protein
VQARAALVQAEEGTPDGAAPSRPLVLPAPDAAGDTGVAIRTPPLQAAVACAVVEGAGAGTLRAGIVSLTGLGEAIGVCPRPEGIPHLIVAGGGTDGRGLALARLRDSEGDSISHVYLRWQLEPITLICEQHFLHRL